MFKVIFIDQISDSTTAEGVSMIVGVYSKSKALLRKTVADQKPSIQITQDKQLNLKI
jgi:hypothetical protein